MKTTNVLFSFMVMAIIFSCNKDKDSDEEQISYRIKEIVSDYSDDADDWKDVFKYEGEKLTKITEYSKDEDGGWILSYKLDITYDDNNATAIFTVYSNGNSQVVDKSNYHIEDGNMIEESNYDWINNEWIIDWTWIYEYTSNHIISWTSFYTPEGGGALIQDGKGEYIYSGETLLEYKKFYYTGMSWIVEDKDTFQYSGNNLSGWINFKQNELGAWVESEKCEYSLNGDKKTKGEYYLWDVDNGLWEGEPYKNISYDYNSNGYLVKRVNDIGSVITLDYEGGKGNAKFFWYYPEELVYGEPTIKSTSLKREYVPYYKRIKHLE